MKKAFYVLLALLATATPARAGDCVAAYEHAVYPYWTIVDDILTYQAMFDNYDRLCTRYYPGIVKSLEPGSDRLRAQVKKDAVEAPRAMSLIFDRALPFAVPTSCRADMKARNSVRAHVLAAMTVRGRTIAQRLRRDSTNLPDPQNALLTCTRLPGLAPVIVKTLGPDLAHPLLEMSVLNSKYMTGQEDERAPYLANYREALGEAEAAAMQPHHRIHSTP